MKEIGLTQSGRIVYSLPADEIVVEEGRIRQAFDPRKLQELKDSVADKGQLLPGICSMEGETVKLVAGERRLRVCMSLNIDYEFFLTTETSPIRIREIEVEENTIRVDLSWPEELTAIEELHAIKQTLNPLAPGQFQGGHTIQDTAELLKKSKSVIAEDLELAKFLVVEEVRNAPTKTEAKKIVKRLKEDFTRAEALKEAQAIALLDEEIREDLKELSRVSGDGGDTPSEDRSQVLFLINSFAPHVHTGRMEQVLETFEPGSFHITFFDPPWGQNLDKVELKRGGKEIFDDFPELFTSNLENWLSIIYRMMAVNSHLYMFFGIKDKGGEDLGEDEAGLIEIEKGKKIWINSFVYTTLEKVGFTTNWMPIIWYKQGMHRVRTPRIWPGRSYEPIAFARKGNKDLQWLGAPDVIITPAPTPSMKGSHMSGKHPDIYLQLLKRSAFPGDRILDPMAGTGMAGVAAEALKPTHQLSWELIEAKEEFSRLAISNLVKGYSKIIFQGAASEKEVEAAFWYCFCGASGKKEELKMDLQTASQTLCPTCGEDSIGSRLEIPLSFTNIPLDDEPESKELWKIYWKIHPDEQDAMLEWKAGKKK